MKRVYFEVDKDAFSAPFICHKTKTKLVDKQMGIKGNIFSYSVWQCPKCRKEFLDDKQSEKMETLWTIEKMLKDDVLAMKRSLNFDGKMFFLRFPKELTRQWTKDNHAEVKVISPNKFIVEIVE